MREIELLAPAKDYDAVRAAIDYGADAVYMGATRFGARAVACNSIEDIALSVEYAHQYGARLYATLNTLIYERELAEAESVAREVVGAGVDALIVQDMAFAKMDLGVELHASTQMCNASVDHCRFLSDSGFSRVVLERNLTLDRIREIGEGCGAELEVFIHGAICVGYSGRCLLSRAMNPQRSGNRGECSQPCRLSYDLCDGSGRRVIEGKHLLSVKDLNLTNHIGDLLDAGATSLKIEGRLKDLSYTKNIVAHYRGVVDRAIAEREGFCRSSRGVSKVDFTPIPSKSFSRGETTYMLEGSRRGVASFDTPKALGEVVGEIVGCRGGRLEVRLRGEVATGDGVCFVGSEGLVGSSVNRIDDNRWITLNRAIEARSVVVGRELYRNYDRLFEASLASSRVRRVIGVEGLLSCDDGVVKVCYRDVDGYEAMATLSDYFGAAKDIDKMSKMIEMQLMKSGDTIFDVERVDISGWSGEFIPSGALAALRREALTKLREVRLRGASEAKHRVYRPMDVSYPERRVGGEVGVTNSLAAAFYRDHGVEQIDDSWECAESLEGRSVMVSDYCIRREIGECLKEGSRLDRELYIERGGDRFRVDVDCVRCQMRLVKV